MAVVEITVRGGMAYLGIGDQELWTKVIDATSFKGTGADYRRGGHGDKRTKLVKNGKAPVGLLDHICRVINTHGDTPQVVYADGEVSLKASIDLHLRNVEPRDYQYEAALAAQLSDSGIFRVPTGGGKTLIICQIAAAKGLYTVVIVPTIDLLYQTKDYLEAHLARNTDQRGNPHWNETYAPPWRVGQLGDGVVDTQPVTVATMRTMAKVVDVAYEKYEFAEYDDNDDTEVNRAELKGWVESLGVVVVDEAHQLGAKVLYQTVIKIPAPCKYGMSASPWRDDGADLMIEAATGPPIFHVTAKRLVERGYLMAPSFRVIDTSKWWTAAAWGTVCSNCDRQWLHWVKECHCGNRTFRSQFNDSYRNEIVENEVRNTHVAQIVGNLTQTGRSVLVLVKRVEHGRRLQQLIPHSIFLSGRNKGEDRHTVFDAVRAGLQRVLICSTIADMGLDIPDLGALVLAGGGKSSTRHLQRIGRVVRPAPGKLPPVVVDFDDSHVHTWYANHLRERRRIEHAEWGDTGAVWVDE